jgi:DNA-directed RNA polymerase, mitochondrial
MLDTQTFDTATLTQARYERHLERQTNAFGLGHTDAAIALVERHLEDTKDTLSETFDAFKVAKDSGRLTKTNTYQGIPLDVFLLDPYVIAMAALQTGISSVGKNDPLSRSLFALGMALEDEVFAFILRNWDELKAKKVRNAVKREGSTAARKKALRVAANDLGFSLEPWNAKARLAAGQWMMDTLLKGVVFTLEGDADRSLALTVEANDMVGAIVDRLLTMNPALLPLTEPPEPWTGVNTTIHGYRVNLIRSFQKVVHQTVGGAIKSGRMAPVLASLNATQGTAWSINSHALEMVEWAYANGVQVEGLPPRDDLPVPQVSDEEWAALDEGQRKEAGRQKAALNKRNRGFIGERMVFETDVATAQHLLGSSFWTPVNMDYRGRVYGLTAFQFQRQDYVRAMFLFAEGKPVDTEGLYWLKVHVANTGAFDKIDKAPFADRVKWVDDNIERILDVGYEPKEELWWTEADAPFMFMVACRELRSVLLNQDGYVCHLPVSFDGTCSGLQHLAAMTRDRNTAQYVNLTNTDRPQDVYNVVAGLAKERVTRDTLNSSTATIARVCLEVGIGRSLVKRNVMTYSYSSGRFGMGEQHMEDTMQPLQHKVLAKLLERHPYVVDEDTFTAKSGDVVTIPGRTAAKYLAGVIHGAIEDVVDLPAQAMRFLQGIAKALSHEGKPVVWHTPLGLPVVMRYPKTTTTRVEMFLHDKGVRIMHKASANTEAPGIDKARASNAIAPGFVHSLDACHLQMVVLAAAEAGIDKVALVHDSFGCLPTDAARFRKLINGQFVSLYGERDVLSDILDEAREQLADPSRLPELPTYGDLDIQEVNDALYAFA